MRPMSWFFIVMTSFSGSLYAPSSSYNSNHQCLFVGAAGLFDYEMRTTQLNLMKFLKTRAPESRVLRGKESDATTLSKRRENPGFFSSALSCSSAMAELVLHANNKGTLNKCLVYGIADLE